jgi:hypothetical protein|tara:strand:- start:809 stop:1078 length:270 start_codon:yes stop_codon:yes gene_type:complete
MKKICARAEEAIMKYANEHTPCTVLEIFEGATLKNGKLLRLSNHSINKFKISHILRRSSEFRVDDTIKLHSSRYGINRKANVDVWVKVK